jgi:hypothetical protein
MGTILIGYGDAGYAHEGYAAQVLDDDSIIGIYSDATRPRMIGQVIAACDCGWVGTTRYPTTTGPFDENAEQSALTEWEHTHALPTVRRLQNKEFDRLGRYLQDLANYLATLASDSLEAQSRAARFDLLDQVLETLERATELARQLQQAERAARSQPAASSTDDWHNSRTGH